MTKGEGLTLEHNARQYINRQSLKAYQFGYKSVVGVPFYQPKDGQLVMVSDCKSMALVYSASGRFKLVCVVVDGDLKPIIINEKAAVTQHEAITPRRRSIFYRATLKAITALLAWVDSHSKAKEIK